MEEQGHQKKEIEESLGDLTEKGDASFSKKGEHIFIYLMNKEEKEAQADLTEEEKEIVHHITLAGTKGMWMASVKKAVSIQSAKVEKILKALVSKGILKNISQIGVRSKVYILAKLEPDTNITGDIWYTQGQFDDNFVNSFLEAILNILSTHAHQNPVRYFPRFCN